MKKLTKIAAAAAALCLGAALLAGCSGSNDAASNAADNGAAANPDATTLIVGLDNAYPPYGFIGDDGNLTGFDIDLATEVAARNGWNLELEAIDWDAKDALLNQGTITASGTALPWRAVRPTTRSRSPTCTTSRSLS